MHRLHGCILQSFNQSIMFCRDNIQPVMPRLMNFGANCHIQTRVPTHALNPNPAVAMYRSLTNLQPEAIQCSIGPRRKQANCSKYDDDVFHSVNNGIHDKRHYETFNNELNHPLMSLDCRKSTQVRSLSPADSGVSSQSSTPGHQRYKPTSKNNYRVGNNHNNNEPRGTKRQYHNNQPSRSPSPRPNSVPRPVSADASRPKRRYQENSETIPASASSTCLLDCSFNTLRPDNLLNGSEWDRLSKAIWSRFTTYEQTSETFKRKLSLRDTVYHCIRNYVPQCGLYIVGSSISGFGSENSDMDLCLVVAAYDIDQRFHALEFLYRVQKALKQCRYFTKLDVIRAKVPILRFFDSINNLEVDLNCNNIVGIRNTHLLKTYARVDWRVRPLVLIVKLWARKHDINDAKSMTISSYSLTLMVIHYLQYGIRPAVLPCLQQVRMERFWPEGDIRRLVSFTDEELKPLKSNNIMTLGQLFAGFLDYFANKFNYNLHTISIRVGGTLPIEQCRRYVSPKNEPHHWKYLCIEEPFDRTNTARSVYDAAAFQRIIDVFRDSAAKIKETKDLYSICP